jgi:hypothetical protein
MYHVQDGKFMVIALAMAAMVSVSAPAMPATAYPQVAVRSDALSLYVAALPAAIDASAPTVGVSEPLPAPAR